MSTVAYSGFGVITLRKNKCRLVHRGCLYEKMKSCRSRTFSTSVNSGGRFCATTRMRRSFELQTSKNTMIEYEQGSNMGT